MGEPAGFQKWKLTLTSVPSRSSYFYYHAPRGVALYTMSGAPEDAPTVHSSQAEVWYLKQITYGGRNCKIITQNFNGSVGFSHSYMLMFM